MKFSFAKIAVLQIGLALPALAGLSDGLAAYYDFETNLQDKSGNGRHLVASGNPEAGWAGGTVTRSGSSIARNTLLAGKALNLVDVDGDLVKAPLGGGSTTAAGAFNLGSSFTISAWHLLAPLPSNTSTRYFVFEGETNYDISWGTSTSDTYKFYNAQTEGGSISLSRNAWHHVVHVFETVDGATLLTVYVDGVRIGDVSASASLIDFAKIVFGDARSGQDRKWDGLLDEIAVWNRALNGQEVDEVHARGINGLGVIQDPSSAAKAYLNLTSEQPLLGTVSGGGFPDVGATIQVTASAAPGYVFAGWTGGFTGRAASFSYTVAESITAAAIFEKDEADADHDGLSNYDEVVIYGSDPATADTDGDGIPDGDEVLYTNTSPTQSDAAMVIQAYASLGHNVSGTIAVETPSIYIEPDSGKIVQEIGLLGSVNGGDWIRLSITSPAISVLPSGEIELSVPAPAVGTSVYEIRAEGR